MQFSQQPDEEALMKSALKLFMQKGYHNTSLRDICNKSNCTTGKFYIYFDSKISLFRLMVRNATDSIDAFVLKYIQALQNQHHITLHDTQVVLLNVLSSTTFIHDIFAYRYAFFTLIRFAGETDYTDYLSETDYANYLGSSVAKVLRKCSKNNLYNLLYIIPAQLDIVIRVALTQVDSDIHAVIDRLKEIL